MPKEKPCEGCGKPYVKQRPLQVACSPKCAIKVVAKRKAKKEARAQARVDKARRADTRRRKEALETRSFVKHKKTQPAFNWMIRERDYYDSCICCGREDHEIPDVYVGGKWDCGHYRTVGAAEELRFCEDNAHKQCKSCNGGSGQFTRKDATVHDQYRENLIKKIGLERVLWIEGPHEPAKWTKEQLRTMAVDFRARARQYKRDRDD